MNPDKTQITVLKNAVHTLCSLLISEGSQHADQAAEIHEYIKDWTGDTKHCIHMDWYIEENQVICAGCGKVLEDYLDKPKPQDL